VWEDDTSTFQNWEDGDLIPPAWNYPGAIAVMNEYGVVYPEVPEGGTVKGCMCESYEPHNCDLDDSPRHVHTQNWDGIAYLFFGMIVLVCGVVSLGIMLLLWCIRDRRSGLAPRVSQQQRREFKYQLVSLNPQETRNLPVL
jgi:hypothetical protein